MRSRSLVAVCLVAAACGGVAPKPASAPQQAKAAPAAPEVQSLSKIVPAEAPGSLFAVVSIPAPIELMSGLAAYWAVMGPGAGTAFGADRYDMLTAELFGERVPGLDWSRPLYALVADVGADQPVALVAAIGDADELFGALDDRDHLAVREHNGYVVLGEAPVVAVVANYALTRLREAPLPKHATGVVRVEAIVAKYRAQLESMRPMLVAELLADPDTAPVAGLLTDSMMSLATQMSEVRWSVRASRDLFEARLDLVGRPGSTLAAFAAAQSPATFSVLGRLPAEPAAFLLAGAIDLGPLAAFREAWKDGMSKSRAFDAQSQTNYADWADQLDGEWALAANMEGGLSMLMVAAVSDGARAHARLRDAYAASARVTGKAMTFSRVGTPAYRAAGFAVDEYQIDMDFTRVPEDQREQQRRVYGASQVAAWATAKDLLFFAMGQREVTRAGIKSLLAMHKAGTRGGAAQWQPFVDDAKDNRESTVVVMDFVEVGKAVRPGLVGQAGAPAVVGLGFGADYMQMRLSVPAASIGAFVSAVSQIGTGGSGDQGAALVAEFDALADRACDCKDAACAKQIGVDMMKVLEGVDDSDEPSKAAQGTIMSAMDRIQQCTKNLPEAGQN